MAGKFKVSQAAGSFITGFADGIGQAWVGNAQIEAKQMVDNAMASYYDTLRDKHNEAVNYGAGQSLNIVAMNEMQINIEQVQQGLALDKAGAVAEAQLTTQLNAIGATGKTAERLKKQVAASIANQKQQINATTDNALLEALFQRKEIEQSRIGNQDYSLNLRSSGGTTNPLMAGLTQGVFQAGATAAKLGSWTK